MQSSRCLQRCRVPACTAAPGTSARFPRKLGRCQAQSGRSAEPFNEGAVQVKRLVDRDRKELLGNKVDILDKYTTEFGDPDDEEQLSSSTATASSSSSSNGSSSSTSTSASSSAAAAAAAPAPAPATTTASMAPAVQPVQAAVQTKFTGSGSTSSPFGAAARSRSLTEPKGLSPDMGPDPIVKPIPQQGNFLSRITITQVVLFFTFSSMIGLMLATFYVVLNSGAVRLAGIE